MDKRSITSRENGKKGGRGKGTAVAGPLLENLQELLKQHAFEEIEEKYGKLVVKKARILHLFDRLYLNSQIVGRDGTDAIGKYLDRILGTPKQSMDVTSQGKTIKIDL